MKRPSEAQRICLEQVSAGMGRRDWRERNLQEDERGRGCRLCTKRRREKVVPGSWNLLSIRLSVGEFLTQAAVGLHAWGL